MLLTCHFTTSEAKEQVLANLANFAYDPNNMEYLKQLQVTDLFLDMLTEENENFVEFGMGEYHTNKSFLTLSLFPNRRISSFLTYPLSCSQGGCVTWVWTLNVETSSCRAVGSAWSQTVCQVRGRRPSCQPSPHSWTSQSPRHALRSQIRPSCSACCASPSQRVHACVTSPLCSCRTAAPRSRWPKQNSRCRDGRLQLASRCPRTKAPIFKWENYFFFGLFVFIKIDTFALHESLVLMIILLKMYNTCKL